MSTDMVNHAVQRAAEQAGIQEVEYVDREGREKCRIHAHTLRHSFAVQSLRNGVNSEYIRRLMGHDELETTRIYLDALDDDLKRVMRKRSP